MGSILALFGVLGLFILWAAIVSPMKALFHSSIFLELSEEPGRRQQANRMDGVSEKWCFSDPGGGGLP
jgi:hypothetical protein